MVHLRRTLQIRGTSEQCDVKLEAKFLHTVQEKCEQLDCPSS